MYKITSFVSCCKENKIKWELMLQGLFCEFFKFKMERKRKNLEKRIRSRVKNLRLVGAFFEDKASGDDSNEDSSLIFPRQQLFYIRYLI